MLKHKGKGRLKASNVEGFAGAKVLFLRLTKACCQADSNAPLVPYILIYACINLIAPAYEAALLDISWLVLPSMTAHACALWVTLANQELLRRVQQKSSRRIEVWSQLSACTCFPWCC